MRKRDKLLIVAQMLRGVILFAVGAVIVGVLNLIQVQRLTNFSNDIWDFVCASSWWMLPCGGIAATIIGLLCPVCDSHFGAKYESEMSNVVRCVALFIGINHGTAKIDFSNDVQLFLTIAAMSLGLWWLTDRSTTGFYCSIFVAFVAAAVTHCLVTFGVLFHQQVDLFYVNSWLPWLPCIFFTGGLTMGNIGRQLATYNFGLDLSHEHED